MCARVRERASERERRERERERERERGREREGVSHRVTNVRPRDAAYVVPMVQI